MILICLFFNMVNGKKSARNKLLGSAISSHEEFSLYFHAWEKKNDCMEYLEEGSFNKHYHQGLKGLKTKKQYL